MTTNQKNFIQNGIDMLRRLMNADTSSITHTTANPQYTAGCMLRTLNWKKLMTMDRITDKDAPDSALKPLPVKIDLLA